MKYAAIKKNDVANGPGMRVSLWTQGCPHCCEDCFNKETWKMNEGKNFTLKEVNEIEKLLENSPVEKHFSVLGGEPLLERNHYFLHLLLCRLKNKFPNINIWMWTGYKFEDVKHFQLLKYVDVLVDGKFEKANKNLMLKFRGSSNQRIIDVQKSLENNSTVLMAEYIE